MNWNFNKTYMMYRGKLNKLTNISKIFIILDFSNQYSVRFFPIFVCYFLFFLCVHLIFTNYYRNNIKIMNFELDSYYIFESSINIWLIFLILTSSFISSIFTLFRLVLTSYLFFLIKFKLQKFFSRCITLSIVAVKVWTI